MSSRVPQMSDHDQPAFVTASRRGFSSIFRTTFTILLTVYAGALLLASWPFGHQLGPFSGLHGASRQLFDLLRTRSGTEVFAGNRGQWKRKSLCVTVVASDSTGSQKKLYETYPHCQVPDARIFEDTFFVLLMRAGYPREMKPLLGASKKNTDKALANLQRSGSLRRASEYFCYSPLARQTRPKHVDILWEVKQVHYGSGKVRTDLLHVHSFDCARARTANTRYRDFRIEREPSGDLTVVDARVGHDG